MLTIAAALYRTPRAVVMGRFWAEEAHSFGPALAGAHFLVALTYIYNGTLFVLTSLPVWAVFEAPLEWAPALLTWYALAIQVGLAVQFGWWARGEGIAPPAVVIGLLAILLSPAMYRLSINATNMQWIASISVFLLLMTSSQPLARKLWPASIWVALCGLTGVPSSMLAPAFLARGILLRSRPHMILGGVLAATAFTQFVLILAHPPKMREYAIWPFLSFVATAAQTVWVNLVGIPIRYLSGFAVDGGTAAIAIGMLLIAGAGIIVACLVFFASRAGTDRRVLAILVGTWLYVSTLNFFGAIGAQLDYLKPIAGERYFVVGLTAYVVLLLFTTKAAEHPVRLAAMILLVWMAAIGAAQGMVPRFYNEFADGPDWQNEIARCRVSPKSPCHARIWPRRGVGETPWMIEIPPSLLESPYGHRPDQREKPDLNTAFTNTVAERSSPK